jgi:mannitol/fructose-specific phosphotransferase system IIA component (Ntr-type)
MSLTRSLRNERVKMELDTREDPALLDDPEQSIRYRWGLKEAVLGEVCALFEAEGAVANQSKLLTDLLNRERKSSTALGKGLAIPHVRTMQARNFTAAVLRSTPGIWFDAADGEKVHLFFAIVAPPYDDQEYLKIYRQLGKAMTEYPEMVEKVLEVGSPAEVIRVLKFYLGG